MAAKSTYLRNALLTHVYGGPDFARPATLYVALLTTLPTDTVAAVELVGTGYARASIDNVPASFNTAADGSKSNAAAFAYPLAGGAWTGIVGFGIYDAAAGGNLLHFGPFTAPLSLTTGEALTIQAGGVTIIER